LKISKIAQILDARIIGSDNIDIVKVSSIELPIENSILLVKKEKMLEKINYEKLTLLIDDSTAKNICPESALVVDYDINIALSKISKIFSYSSKFSTEKNGCYIADNVDIGVNVEIGNNVVIEDNVRIGDRVKISHNVVIGHHTVIGNDVDIDSGTVIGSEGFGNVKDNNIWHHIHHMGNVVIGDKVFIGANCCIDRGTIDNTIIENGVIIDNLVHIAHNVTIGENTAIAAKVGIAGSSHIGKRNMIGGMVGIVDHITTSDDVIISATSTVNKDIMEPGTYTGIMPISKHSSWKRIAFWITKLDKIVKRFNIKKI